MLLAPVAAATLFTAYSLHSSQVGAHDVAVFAIYLALGLVVPGTVMWRMLVSRGSWGLLADVAFGTSLAYAVELGVYLVCAHFDHPGVAYVWPVIPLAASLIPPLRGYVWHRLEPRTPVWISWVLSTLVVFVVAVLTRANWDSFPLKGVRLREPYVDIPYHLSLIGALSRHVPVDVPAVAGEPLYYHWFVHADLAAERHATGIEPLILLTRLGPLAMAVVVIIGVAALAHRLTGSWLVAGLAPTLLCCAGGAALSRDFGRLFVSGYIFLSPTTIFAMALLIAVTAVSLELLGPYDGPERERIGLWLVLVVTLGAVSGAKGSLLPVLLGGYAAAVLMALVVRRTLDKVAFGILVIGAVWFEVAQRLVYGGSAQGTALKPFGVGDRVAANIGFDKGHVPLVVAAAVTAVYLGSRVTVWVPAVGLFTRDAWRDRRAHFLVGAVVAAGSAVVVFDSPAFNEVYFLLVAPPLIAVSSAWGLAVLTGRIPPKLARPALAAGLAIGLAVGFGCKFLFIDRQPAHFTEARLLLPPAIALLVCLVAALVVAVILGGGHRRLVATLVAACAIGSLGVPVTLATVSTMATTPQDQFRATATHARPSIGAGGIAAARWLRDHSAPGDLVATNAHCRVPGPICDHRTTWIAGFTERQILIEGWSYTSRSGAEAEKLHVAVSQLPFWEPGKLDDNDEAFSAPSAANVARLHDHYGVKWMFVDTRFDADAATLERYATLSFSLGQYLVFRLG